MSMAAVTNNMQNLQINIDNDIHAFPKGTCRIGLKDNKVTVRDVADDRTEIITLDWSTTTDPSEPNNTALALKLIEYLSTGTGGASSTTTNFGIQIALGNLEGISGRRVSARAEGVGMSFEDVWAGSSDLVYPTVGEQWEILSASPNDTSAGTGVRSVLITYLDDNYIEQEETIILNGTTPVSSVATDMFRFQDAKALTWGSTGENQALITIRVVGGGADRGFIDYSTDFSKGTNISGGSHFTIPNGKILVVTSAFHSSNQGNEITVWLMVRKFGEDGFLLAGESSLSEDALQALFSPSFSAILPKADFKIIAFSQSAGGRVNAAITGVLIDVQ